jgi:hypothetical protein
MVSVSDRNATAARHTERFFDLAAGRTPVPPGVKTADLEAIVACGSRGLREILLTVTVGRLLDCSYKTTALYDCNPRALFEGPIREVLDGHRIPRGKSGPLNMAKATKALDAAWAARRRPRDVALRVVQVAEAVDSMSPGDLTGLGAAIAKLLLEEARRVDDLAVDLDPTEDPISLANMMAEMIIGVPDSGNTPQRIIGLLLDARERAKGSPVEVLGLNDRASVTSTTAKKLGDLALALPDGTVTAPMEVTVKPFNEPRAMEAAEAAHEYAEAAGMPVFEILVVCRPEDVHPDATRYSASSLMGLYAKDGIAFYFVNIFDWILGQLLEMPASARSEFHSQVNEYVADPSTRKAVKVIWRGLNSE